MPIRDEKTAPSAARWTPHPYAEKFPMLPESELEELTESIRANGLRNPIVTDREGRIIDGRNRAAACDRLGVEPETVVYEGDDIAEYVIDCNVTRRNMSTGARAMATALVLAAAGQREGGRWAHEALAESHGSVSLRSWRERMKECGVVLDFTPDAADAVVTGDLALDAAFKRADEIRRSEEADKVRERERKKREKQEAKAEAERNAQIIADLTEAEQTKYLALIEDGTVTPAEAWAAYQEATRKERDAERALDQGRRDTCTRIAECVRYLDGGRDYGETFLRDFYPHETRFLAEGMWLTGDRIDAAVDFLSTIRKGLREGQ